MYVCTHAHMYMYVHMNMCMYMYVVCMYTQYPTHYIVSLSMVVLNSRDQPGKLWVPDFLSGFAENTDLNAFTLLSNKVISLNASNS